MKNKNVTFSLPVELTAQLHNIVGKRGLSKFVSLALEKALAEKVKNLKAAYQEAEEDTDRLRVIEDWKDVETEGWDE